MADKSGSPAFKPPLDHITSDDPQIVRVPMESVDWAFRKSQAPVMKETATGPVRHITNGN